MTEQEAIRIVFEDIRPIQSGDRVIVRWNPMINDLKGKVIYVPVDTGDSWHIQDNEGRSHYVQSFTIMTREPTKEWYRARAFLNDSVGH